MDTRHFRSQQSTSMDLRTMETIDTYLQTTYIEERRELDRIDKLIEDVCPLFVRFQTKNGWPYQIDDGDIEPEVNTVSQSTVSMITFVLAQLLGFLRKSPLLPTVTTALGHQSSEYWPKVRHSLY